MAKQSLNLKKQQADRKANILGVAAAELGDILGNYECERRIAGATVEIMVKDKLDYMMLNGLTVDDSVDMLKAPNKSNPGELYVILVTAMNMPLWLNACIDNDIEVDSMTDAQKAEFGMVKGRRDKYVSKCRTYVRNRGVLPLDLHDNAYRNAKKSNGAAAKPEADAAVATAVKPEANEEAVQLDKPPVMNAKGLTAMRDFLALFIEQNDEPDASAELQSVLELADDLLDATKSAIVKLQGKSKDKGTKKSK